jgi:hypothetical protein
MEIVDEVPAAHDENPENPLFSQRREALADLVVERCRLVFINTELHDRNICFRVNMAQHLPSPMLKTQRSSRLTGKGASRFRTRAASSTTARYI